jgi:hypothetical protein
MMCCAVMLKYAPRRIVVLIITLIAFSGRNALGDIANMLAINGAVVKIYGNALNSL